MSVLFEDVTKGDDWEADPKTGTLATAGIRLGRHGNAIEFHDEDLTKAQSRRDIVLYWLQCCPRKNETHAQVIRRRAEWELAQEEFNAEVLKEKERIKNKRPLWDRIFPYKIVRKER